MARKKPVRRSRRTRPASGRASRRGAGRRVARPGRRRTSSRSAKTVRRKSRKRTAKPAARRTANRQARKPKALKRAASARPAPKTAAAPRRAPRAAAAPRQQTPKAAAVPKRQPLAPPQLDRERRRLADIERESASPTEADSRASAAARSGREELRANIKRHTETSPVLTAGDVDARWDDAYAVGDEAPGGDNPTPDQDRVDDIGKALGVVYEDNEELRASDKVAKRDKHRWELDPASSEDWPHDKES